MIERLEITKKRYEEILTEINNPENLNDYKKINVLLREQKNLEPIIEKYEEYIKIIENIQELEQMQNDPELSSMVKEELNTLYLQKEKCTDELEFLLIPKDENDHRNIIMEIRGAAGGDEANIFAGDLFRMYSRYVEKNGWKIEIINEIPGSSGGYAQIEFSIIGENVYSKLKYESGSHRVQRVPETETQGRIHTSTSTVIVMPEAESVDVDINDNDIKIDVYHSGGAGGQSVNTTDSAVRITHLPTGIVVTCQNERSQLKNKAKAMEILKTRIFDYELQKQLEAQGIERKNKIGTGDRSEKIRTYNYPQNRVTDHRIGLTLMNLDKIMEGNIEEIIDALITENQKKELESK